MQVHRRRMHIWIECILTACLAVGIVFGMDKICSDLRMLHAIQTFTYDEEKLRKFSVSTEVLSYYLDGEGTGKVDLAEELAVSVIINDYRVESYQDIRNCPVSERFRGMIKSKKEYAMIYGVYQSMVNDLVYFPVPIDLNGNERIGFEDSWGSRRSFGGERQHEGCDLMTSNNMRGYFPIVSITDGVVENKGWLKLGGYRIGIRSKSGGYFYYAHLFSYADGIEIGDNIKAGELLGFMGDSGYSEVEGTTGKFDVHLHMGMYVTMDGREVSVNPYFILKYLEKHKLAYYF